MPAYLVRHAHAGSKSQWNGDDAERPLSRRGRAQADAIADQLAADRIGRIVSSPTARCTQTVEPLAERLDLRVRTRPILAPAADPADAVRYLMHHAADHPVMCTHGELIPKMISLLIDQGLRVKDPIVAEKASIWVLDLNRRSARRGRYRPPPAVKD